MDDQIASHKVLNVRAVAEPLHPPDERRDESNDVPPTSVHKIYVPRLSADWMEEEMRQERKVICHI